MSEPINPYAPPETPDAPEEASAADLVDASQGTRFVNLIVDLLCRTAFAFVLGIAVKILGVDLRDQAASAGFGLLSMVIYYVGFEALFGRTPGKFVTGTRVVRADGGKPSLGAIVGRTFARFVPFEPFSFLGTGSGWHDSWSGTRVVVVRR